MNIEACRGACGVVVALVCVASMGRAEPAEAQPAPTEPAPAAASAAPSASDASPPPQPPSPMAPVTSEATGGEATASASMAPPAPVPLPAATAPAAVTTAEAEEGPPNKLTVADEGFLRFGALLQLWTLLSREDDTTELGFRVRRSEFKLSGQILPKLVGYKLMVDPSVALESESESLPVEGQDPAPTEAGTVTVEQPGGRLSILQDVALTFLSEYADVSIGQFKNGVSYEGFNSSSALIFPERAPVSRTFGDRRDIGVSAEKRFQHFGYFVGLFNGTGQNRRDDNNQKDLALRLELLPMEGLLFGAVGYASIGQRDRATTQDRVEADVRLELADFLLQTEYIRGWEGASDARVAGHGFYAALGYTFLERLQPIARFGILDVDLDADGSGDSDELTHYDLGMNYFVAGNQARLGLSASLFDHDTEPTRTDVILMAQGSF